MSIILNSELESRIVAKLKTGRYNSPEEVVEEGLALLDARDAVPATGGPSNASGIAEMIQAISSQVPEEEWLRVPADLSLNVDHYLYGSPRREE